ncbi:MAG TPA: proteasome-type protease [Burkholderiales bacterium]|nr:proteasome-type protease [Burkholderiales bacterium]
MTYCVAAAISSGIVFASDTRTNAGVDYISTFSKMTVFEAVGERVVVMLSSGNLGVTQSVVSLLRLRQADGVLAARSMYDVAVLIGETLREVMQRDGASLQARNIDAGCNFIVGGQIAGEAPRLFHVYPEGNFIEASVDTNYFQIGETKYGKPIIDRVVKYDVPMKDAAKCLLVSFDSTMRSNLSVGLPIDLLGYEKDSLRVTLRRRFLENDPYFREISQFWSAGLRRVFQEVPDVSWD